jgi:peptidoglycan/xylan/chitin deacetylase (PgdA/CDA1 family)
MPSSARNLLLASYYLATQPIRAAIHYRLKRKKQLPSPVFFYHRVADDGATPWTISNANFKKHIQYLKSNFDLVSFPELQARLRKGEGDRIAVAITFDDGYASNFDHAIPWMLENNIPFTYFVSTAYSLTQSPFPHDRKLGFSFQPNTPAQIRQLAESGVTLGGHTRSHADIGSLTDLEQIEEEIIGGIRELEDMSGTRIEYFAFPYGDIRNISQASINCLRRNGIQGICSAYNELNWPGKDPWHIKRIHGDCGMLRLKNWMTLDPRKLKRKRRFPFEYHTLNEPQPTFVFPHSETENAFPKIAEAMHHNESLMTPPLSTH